MESQQDEVVGSDGGGKDGGERDNQVGNISRDSNDNFMSVDEDIGDKTENLDNGGGEGVEASNDGDLINVEDLKFVMNGTVEIIDQILGKVGIDAGSMDLSECNNNGFKVVKKKLAVVESFLNVHHHVKDLNEAVSNFNELITAKPSENIVESQGDALKECYTVDYITNKFSEFTYDAGNFSCSVCDVKVAIYGVDLEDDFRGKVQSD